MPEPTIMIPTICSYSVLKCTALYHASFLGNHFSHGLQVHSTRLLIYRNFLDPDIQELSRLVKGSMGSDGNKYFRMQDPFDIPSPVTVHFDSKEEGLKIGRTSISLSLVII